MFGLQPQRRKNYESPAAKPEGVDPAEVDHKEWQAIVEDRREIFAGGGYQVAHTGRVCSYDQGKAGGKESWQAVRRAAKTHSAEDSEV